MGQGVFYTFWFEKNLQGDIVAVYNETGTKLISYVYDAWGNFRTTTHNCSGTNAYAAYNPFRYRGYYYDDFHGCFDEYGMETGFYYLNSRYYNPQWGRFLNADGYVSTGTGLLGYNMFAYCNNNPVMYVDPDGGFPFIVFAFVPVVVGIIIVHYNRNHWNEEPDESELQNIVDGKTDWEEQMPEKNLYHTYTTGEQGDDAIYNKKYLNGNSEIVICYDREKQPVPYISHDPINMGTYNFVNPDGTWDNEILHMIVDVVPYYILGNKPFERTWIWDRVRGNKR